jgi:excisionase family DNA binding protein
MKAYATSERLPLGEQLRTLDPGSVRSTATTSNSDSAVIDQILGRLADLVVDRLLWHSEASTNDKSCDWLDARGAAAYLGIHRDTLRKLAAQRAVPTHQDGPRCKLYFRRDELDEWRRSARPVGSGAVQLRTVS